MADVLAAAFARLAPDEAFLRSAITTTHAIVAARIAQRTSLPTVILKDWIEQFTLAEHGRRALITGIERHVPELSGLNPNPIEYDWPDGRMEQIAEELRNLAKRAREIVGLERAASVQSKRPAEDDVLRGVAQHKESASIQENPRMRPERLQPVVLWEGAELTDHNLRLARTRTAYLEAHGKVSAALALLKADGHDISRSTVYNHLDALDKATPGWRNGVLVSSPGGNLDGLHRIRTRQKPRGNAR